MNQPDYSYQDNLISEVYDHLLKNKRVVLAACPGAGKTNMAIKVIYKYLEIFPEAKILILTHGQVLLRNQWVERFVDKTNNITIALPQSYNKIIKTHKKIDLLIVDEAHHYFYGEMIQTIIKKTHPHHILLLTGTPSQYIDDSNWHIVGITLKELLTYNVVTDPKIELLESKYPIHLNDYNEEYHVRKTLEINKDSTIKTIDEILKRLPSPLRKTVIVCFNQNQAKIVNQYLHRIKINSLLSISDNTEGTEELYLFKMDTTYPILIVVNRGILGFDYVGLYNVVDMTGSLNVNRIFQLLCRVVRRSDKPEDKKLFLKITSQEMLTPTYFVMSFAVALSHPDYYFTYKKSWTPMPDIKIPVDVKVLEKISESIKHKNKISLPDLPSLMTFNDYPLKSEKDSLREVAYTTFKDVINRLENKPIWNYENLPEILKQYKSREDLKNKNYQLYNHVYYKYPQLVNDIFGKTSRQKWTVDSAIEEGKKYKSRVDFKNNSNAYNWLNKHKYLDELRSILPTQTKWDEKKAVAAIKKCKTLKIIQKSSPYHFLRKKNKLHLVKDILDKKRTIKFWDKDSVIKVAYKIKRRTDIYKLFPGAVGWADRNGFREELNKILDKRFEQWNVIIAKNELYKYKRRTDLRRANESLYQWVRNNAKYLFEEVYGPERSWRSSSI